MRIIIIIVSFLSLSTFSAQKYPSNHELGGVKSLYTDILKTLPAQWPPKNQGFESLPKDAISAELIETPGNKYYVGVELSMWIHTPIARVEEVINAIDEYQKYFPGYKDIRVLEQDGNKILTFWEQIIPVFFISNIKYQMNYLIDKSISKKIIYRFQLKQSSDIKTCDGIIFLEDFGNISRYTEYDFVDTDSAFLKAFASSRIWEDTFETIYQSDVGIKLKSEHPDWDHSKILKESKLKYDALPLEAILNKRKPFYIPVIPLPEK